MLQSLRKLILISLLLLNNTEVLAQSQIYIFVSFSMNDQALKSYYLEAQKIGAILVMRGLKDNSFFETKVKVDKLAINFNIDSNLFEQYQITSVPAIIVDDGQGRIKKLTGHIALLKAMEIMEENIGENSS
ncbi:type-F conjugative transfer system pilin assembly protein TrbC [Candidatus Tisiphia endosymbiont of Oplodontha viridula]|uniref:type-F conjugative transfer system pilin assembly protein TrbC n=1 Tax=Candidatus Tisiphia endosymbiont of Oplodontha viridula TaxID=3077925 RepID=UPI0035C8B69E